jgi:hypothetical protein
MMDCVRLTTNSQSPPDHCVFGMPSPRKSGAAGVANCLFSKCKCHHGLKLRARCEKTFFNIVGIFLEGALPDQDGPDYVRRCVLAHDESIAGAFVAGPRNSITDSEDVVDLLLACYLQTV